MSTKISKTPREIERIMKGVANHHRVRILQLLEKKPELSLADITGELKLNFKTGAEHTRRLAIAGLVLKRHEGNTVRHALSLRAKSILKFLRTLS